MKSNLVKSNAVTTNFGTTNFGTTNFGTSNSGNSKTVSIDQIKCSYFGATTGRAPEREEQAAVTAGRNNELTPSAKYIATEAKKRIGQKMALADLAAPDEEDLFQLVRSLENSEGEELSERERTAVVAALSASLDHYDILQPLVENPEVNDIIIRAYNDISIQTGRRNVQTDLRFADKASYVSFAENLIKRAGKACTLATPVIDAAVDPTVRVCLTHESFSPPGSGPMMTLRVARHTKASIEGLVTHELAPRVILDYLAALVRSGTATMLIAGEVGTGKTTLIKALASQICDDEALLIIEDTHELVLQRRFTRTLLTREANTEGAGRINPAQAIRTGMRMAMNRVILGEMRDAESAEAFVDVCASGHAGMSTIHARNARDALSRLELFLTRAQPGVSIESVRRQLANAISVVVYLAVDKELHKRRIISVLEVGSSADGTVQLSPLFSYAPQKFGSQTIPAWRRDGGVSLFNDLLSEQRATLPLPGTELSLDPEELYHSINDQSFSWGDE